MNRSDSLRRWAPWIAALFATGMTALVAELVAGRYSLGPVDDAFISLRYAENWATGRGLCFNVGQTVEGYTNFLLVLIEALAIRCGVDPVLAMTLMGRVSLACLGGLFALFAFIYISPGALVPATAFGVLAASNPVLICWGFSGMESCLYALMLMGALLAALAADRPFRWILSATCMILAAMTRPEGVIMFPVVLLAVYLKRRSMRVVLFYGCLFLVAFGGYFVARAMHFGHLLPNTFYAKLDYGNRFLLWRGALYVWDFVQATPLLFVLAGAALFLVREAPLWVKACLLIVAAQLAATVYEGGDHFAMFRFFVPVVPFLAALALYPCTVIIKKYRLRSFPGVAAVLVGLVALGVSDVFVGRQSKQYGTRTATQFERFVGECVYTKQWAQLGWWFRQAVPSDASLTTIAIGAIGYYSRLAIIDPHGIIDPAIAHLNQELGSGYAGHEKYDVAHVLSQRPGYILAVHVLTRAPVPKEALSRAAWGEFNRSLPGNPQLDREYRYEVIRLRGGFLNLFVRRDLPTPGMDAWPPRKRGTP